MDLKLFVSPVNRQTKVSANDGRWHHICATWEHTAGSWNLYKDGVVEDNDNKGEGLKEGRCSATTGTQIHLSLLTE